MTKIPENLLWNPVGETERHHLPARSGKTTAAGYVRTASDNCSGTNAHFQVMHILKYAEANEIPVGQIYIDAGESGLKLDRTGLNKMLKAAIAGDFDILIVRD